jgi:transcriptional regulator with XRE-family HTH domain
MNLGSRITRWREAKRLTRQDLARAVGVTDAAVYQWEATDDNKTTPSVAHLEMIVGALGLTMVRFYGRLPKKAA